MRPELDPDFRISDFGRIDEAVDEGYAAMVEALDRTDAEIGTGRELGAYGAASKGGS